MFEVSGRSSNGFGPTESESNERPRPHKALCVSCTAPLWRPVSSASETEPKLRHRLSRQRCPLLLLSLGIGYIIIFPLYAYVGPPPSGADAWFKYLPGKTTAWWVIVGLSVFTDFLFVPLALALYLALKGCNRNAMLLAVAFVGLFVVLDLAVTWSHYASILTLYGKYSIATDDVQRGGFLAAANY